MQTAPSTRRQHGAAAAARDEPQDVEILEERPASPLLDGDNKENVRAGGASTTTTTTNRSRSQNSRSAAMADPSDDMADQQSTEERRFLRAQYRNLISKAEEQRRFMMSGEPDVDLAADLIQVNSLFAKVKTTQDAALDSKALLQLAEISAQKIQKLKIDGGSFNLEDYVTKVAARLGGRTAAAAANDRRGSAATDDTADHDEDADAYDEEELGQSFQGRAIRGRMRWDVLDESLLKLMSRAPINGFMYGAIAIEPKQRERAKRAPQRLNKDPSKLRQPEQLAEQDIQKQEHETSTSVQNIYMQLRQVEPIPLFKFFINPQSFSQSVENLFHLSFLVRDGRVSIMNEDNDLILASSSPPTEADAQQGVVNIQHIMHFDMETWEMAIKAYDLIDSVIETRESVNQNSGARWYG